MLCQIQLFQFDFFSVRQWIYTNQVVRLKRKNFQVVQFVQLTKFNQNLIIFVFIEVYSKQIIKKVFLDEVCCLFKNLILNQINLFW